jgi:hypothetical protein
MHRAVRTFSWLEGIVRIHRWVLNKISRKPNVQIPRSLESSFMHSFEIVFTMTVCCIAHHSMRPTMRHWTGPNEPSQTSKARSKHSQIPSTPSRFSITSDIAATGWDSTTRPWNTTTMPWLQFVGLDSVSSTLLLRSTASPFYTSNSSNKVENKATAGDVWKVSWDQTVGTLTPSYADVVRSTDGSVASQ